MRRLRRLLLFGVLVVLCVVGGTYYYRRSIQRSLAPPVPEVLPRNVSAEGNDWVYTQHDGRRPVVEVRAGKMRQVAEPSQFELEQVQLRIFDKDGEHYDHVRSAYASFDTAEGILFSDGEVEITMAVPAEGPPRERLTLIRSSGVRFEATTGKATTDRAASFTFGRGEGRSVGASYDPNTRDLRMHSEVELRWKGEGPQGKLMTVEASELLYKEDQSKVFLYPWSRLKRATLDLEAADSVVTLHEGTIRVVEAENARGSDSYPDRQIEYAAARLTMNFTPKGEVEKIVGERDAKLVSASGSAYTTITTDRIDLDLEPSSGDSFLKTALATGGSLLESKPRPPASGPLAETRILRSDIIKALMRPGGKEIEAIETHAPGTVEFLPNLPEQKRRRLDGERLCIHYDTASRIRSLRAVSVSTRTENGPQIGQPSAPPFLTWSKDLLAEFDPETSKLTRLEQWGDFRYEEGLRKGKADRAVLDARHNLITLEGEARVWDQTGSTAADRILLDEQSGDLTATGHVSATRLPEEKSPGGMLSQNESLHATAETMASTAGNANIVYEGKAVLWQGASRLQAGRIEIDRTQQVLKARGDVITQSLDTPDKSAGGESLANGHTPPVFTVIRAPELIYVEGDRLAHYRGGVLLNRSGMDIHAREIRVFFTKAEQGATLDYAVADGEVKILHKEADRTRTGVAEHAEYYAAEEKVVLKGGRPRVIDSLRGTTEGSQLTYFSGSGRLLVDGAEAQPSVTRLHRQ